MNHTDAARLARQLMNQHGLTQVAFEWDRSKKRAGCCSWYRGPFDTEHYCKNISLSMYYVQMNDEAEIRNTILHEIAHGLAGFSHGHNAHWRRIARSIGCNGERCYSRKEVNMPKGRYQATCNCGKTFHKHRLGSRVRSGGLRCRTCRTVLRFVDIQRSPVYA